MEKLKDIIAQVDNNIKIISYLDVGSAISTCDEEA